MIRGTPPGPGLGRPVFAATLAAIGLWSLLHGGVAPIWEPIPRHWPLRQALGPVCALVTLVGGAGLLWRRSAAAAAGGLFATLLAGMLAFKAPAIIRAPATAVAWESCGETAVLVAAAWILFADLAQGADSALRHLVGCQGRRGAVVLFGLALIAFGVAHLSYLDLTASLVPRWLPAPEAWVAFTAGTYVLAGVGLLASMRPRLAAALSGLQIGAFTMLVWAPRIAAAHAGAADWSEATISWALTAGAWVMADGLAPAGRRE